MTPMPPRLIAILALLAAPSVAAAQWGVSASIRSVRGTETARANADRGGADVRGHYDGRMASRLGWRAEFTGVQMQYQRDIPGSNRRQVSENGIEIPLLLRVALGADASRGLTVVSGPVASWRINCGASGGFVACDDTPGARVGWLLGVGFAKPISDSGDLLLEARLTDGVVAGAGIPVLTLGAGLRRHPPRPSPVR